MLLCGTGDTTGYGYEGARADAEKTQFLNASCLGGMKDSGSHCRGWGDTGVHNGGRTVLVNHFSKPFGKVEVSPNGEEALGKEQGVSLCPLGVWRHLFQTNT